MWRKWVYAQLDDIPDAVILSPYRYLGPSRVDDTKFRPKRGYWVYVNSSEGGVLTLPSVGGSVSGESYAWSKLRVSNGTMELSLEDASNNTYQWVEQYLRYWDDSSEDFLAVCKGTGFGYPNYCANTSMQSLNGYFINGLQDNLALIRQN